MVPNSSQSAASSVPFKERKKNVKIIGSCANGLQVLDTVGVGELVKIATERGRASNPKLTVGICGEQGGEPSSVAFVDGLNLDYVSCSPLRVPIARLAAAQSTIRAAKTA
jgi:pyruvate, orthophosphate dikinase